MSTFSELQQELMLLWNSRIKNIKGLKETGRHFNKPLSYMIDRSQRNYYLMMEDMKKQMRLVQKQVSVLQEDINGVLKRVNPDKKKPGSGEIQLSK